MPSISGQHSIVLLIKDIVSSAFDQENDALHHELEKAAVLPDTLFIHSICVCPAWHDYFEGSHIILWMEVPHGEVDKSR